MALIPPGGLIMQRIAVEQLPTTIANAATDYLDAASDAERFRRLIEISQETIRFLVLLGVASYAASRPARESAQIDSALTRLRRPSLGDWLNALKLLHRYHEPMQGLIGLDLQQKRAVPELCQLCIEHGNWKESTTKVSIFHVLDVLVAVRNRRDGHGSISEAEAGPFLQNMMPALRWILSHSPCLTAKALIYAEDVPHVPGRQARVRLRRLCGTGRFRPEEVVTDEPGLLEADRVFFWTGEDAALPLHPFLHFHNNRLFVFRQLKHGVPVYDSRRANEHDVKAADDLIESFRERAGFILKRMEGQPLSPIDIYEAGLLRAAADDVITPDEQAILESIRDQLGLGDEDVQHLYARLPTAPRLGEPDGQPSVEKVEHFPSLESENHRDPELERLIGSGTASDAEIARYIEALCETSRPKEALQAAEVLVARRETADRLGALAFALLHDNQFDNARRVAERAVAQGDANAVTYWYLLLCRREVGDRNGASEAAALGLVLDPDNPRLRACAALLSPDASPRARLREVSAICRETESFDPWLFLHEVEVLVDLERWEEADRLLASCIRRSPKNHVLLAFRAMISLVTGRDDAARKLVQNALRLNQESSLAILLQGLILLTRDGDIDAGMERIRDADELLFRSVESRLAIAEMLKAVGLTAEHRRIIDSLRERDPQNPQIQLKFAAALVDSGDLESARVIVSKLLEKEPRWVEARHLELRLCLESEQFDRAEQLLAELPDSPERVRLSARLLHTVGRFLEVIELLEEYLGARPLDTEAAWTLAWAYRDAGKYLDLAAFLEHGCLEVSASDHHVALALAAFHAGDEERVHHHLEGILLTDGVISEYWEVALNLAVEIGEHQLATRICERFLETAPDSSTAHLARFAEGYLHAAEGRPGDAVEAYELALALSPNDPQTLGELFDLEEQRGHIAARKAYGERLCQVVDVDEIASNTIDLSKLRALRHRLETCDEPTADELTGRLLSGDIADALLQQLAEAWLARGKTGRARDLLNHLDITQVPKSLIETAARVLLADNAFAEARRLADLVATQHPDDAAVLWCSARIMWELDRNDLAARYFRRARRLSSSPDVGLEYAASLCWSGSLEEANGIYEQVFRENPVPYVADTWIFTLLNCGYLDAAHRSLDAITAALSDAANRYTAVIATFKPEEVKTASAGAEDEPARALLRWAKDLLPSSGSERRRSVLSSSDADDSAPLVRWVKARFLWSQNKELEAIEVLEALLDEIPPHQARGPRRDLVTLLVRRGEHDAALACLKGADGPAELHDLDFAKDASPHLVADYLEALVPLLEWRLAESPEDLAAKHALMVSVNRLGTMYRDAGVKGLALPLLQRGLEFSRELYEARPETESGVNLAIGILAYQTVCESIADRLELVSDAERLLRVVESQDPDATQVAHAHKILREKKAELEQLRETGAALEATQH